MIKICMFDSNELNTLELSLIYSSLPFGKSEVKRLEDTTCSSLLKERLGGLIALQRLTSDICTTCDLAIERDANGKPYFPNATHIPFGISHSHGISAAAVGDGDCVSVGFDIEVLKYRARFEEIAKRYFSESEILELSTHGYDPERFFSMWTAKEALAKLNGHGLSAVISNKTSLPTNSHISTHSTELNGKRIIFSVCHYGYPQKIKQISVNGGT